MNRPGFLDAAQASRQLGVSRATLYAYVSRGLLGSIPEPGSRRSLYREVDVRRLADRRGHGRRPRQAAGLALDWGLPVMPSSLTLIEPAGRIFHRGQPLEQLAQTASLEDIAALLWQATRDEAFGGPPPALPRSWRSQAAQVAALEPPSRCLALFASWQIGVGSATLGAGRSHVMSTCGTLVRLMLATVTGAPADRRPIHAQLADHWGVDAAGAQALRQALVLCADHELNASSFTARCVASTGAELGAAVIGGLAALSGGLHGGMSAQVDAMLDDLSGRRAIASALARRLARDNRLPGFGHRLYPDGDPRARLILRALPPDPLMRRVMLAARSVAGLEPNLDYGLVALQRRLGLPTGSAFSIFALGRTVGWLAHALEQREHGQLIRPRAAYVGPHPTPPESLAGRVIRRR